MIFSIIVGLTQGLVGIPAETVDPPSAVSARAITGGAIIYRFTGASTQAVTTGAYERSSSSRRTSGSRGRKLRWRTRKGRRHLHAVRAEGHVQHLLTVFFATLAFAFVEPYFFIGYLISIALFGLYQAIFMANAGGAWDNAKKIVEVELKEKGSELHAATVVGDTVGDPFKDTSSVALNPIIKFTTLFGLLAVELAVSLSASKGPTLGHILAAVFLFAALVFVYRSFYGMRIETKAAV
jgi:K(+)-stimulated pyrophosphate-energized sodium pump